MEHFTLQHADVLLVDPDLHMRNIVKAMLHDFGFRTIRLATTLEDVKTETAKATPDLLVAEVLLADGDFCAYVRALRHHEVSGNPFLPVIGVTWDPTLDLVRRVIDSGADDLLAKPIAPAQMQDRIRTLIVARRPFGVTSDYVGPDRRSAAEAREATIPLIDVPNTLKAKATGADQQLDMQKAIDEAITEVNLHKLDRHAHQINGLLGEILPPLEDGQADATVHAALDRLLYVAEDSSRRMAGTPYEHVSELCGSLIQVVRDILDAGAKPKPKDVKLLRPLGQAIHAGFTAGTAAVAREISATVGAKGRGGR